MEARAVVMAAVDVLRDCVDGGGGGAGRRVSCRNRWGSDLNAS